MKTSIFKNKFIALKDSIEDYLSGRMLGDIRYEDAQGQVYFFGVALLWQCLRGKPCFPLRSDMMLKTSEKSYRYPDLIVVYGLNLGLIINRDMIQ